MYQLKPKQLSKSSSVVDLQEYNLAYKLDNLERRNPYKVALIEGKKELSFQTLNQRVSHEAINLRESGIRKNDVVLILIPQSIELFVSILAIFKLGATVMFVDPSMSKASIESSILQVKPRAAILSIKAYIFTSLFKSIRAIPIKVVKQNWSIFSDSPLKETIETTPVKKSHNALITFTSGSSGHPKAIVRSHAFLNTQLKVLTKELDIKESQIELTGLPMFVLANIARGSTTVLSKSKLSNPAKACGKTLVNEIETNKITSLLGSPSLISNIANQAIKKNKKLESVEKVLTGGGTVSLDLLERISRACPKADILTVYGSSEAEPICHHSFRHASKTDKTITKSGGGVLVGYPVESIEIKIVELTSNHKLNDHIRKLQNYSNIQIGEILVTGPHVNKEYYNQIGDSKNKILLDGKLWHRTGDTGYLDRLGRLWLTGSTRKEVDTTFSTAIEQCANTMGDLESSAFILYKGMKILFVTKAIKEGYVMKELAFADIDEIRLVRSLPLDKRHNSKVLYNELTKRVLST